MTIKLNINEPVELTDGTPVRLRQDDGSSIPYCFELLAERLGCRVGYQFWTDPQGRCSDDWIVRNVDPSIPAHLARARHDWLTKPELHPDFTGEDWFAPHKELHFPLLADVDGIAMISFFENERKLEAGRRTEMRVGRYVRRFNGGKLKDEDVERIAATADVKLRGNRVKITQDADEIESVYTHGPRSCMSHSAGTFSTGGIHPARVYAGPDLAVAYIGELDDASSRCVVWPDKKLHSTIYGDYTRMENMLRQMGYEEGDMDGARVRLIECDYGVVMPYVDGVSYADPCYSDGTVKLGHGDLETDRTDGLGTDDCRTTCEHCDDIVSDDETSTVYTARYDYETWCDSCRSEDATYCGFSGHYVRDDLMVDVVRHNGNTDQCAQWELDRNDFVLVTAGDREGEYHHIDNVGEHDGDWYHVDDLPEDEDDDGQDVPSVTVEEAEAAGQMALPLDTVGDFRVRGYEAGAEPFDCVLEGAGGPASEYRRTGTYAECVRARDTIAPLYRRIDYRIEPVNASQQFRVRRTGEGTTSHVWFEAIIGYDDRSDYRAGTFEEALRVQRRMIDDHGRRHTYTVEPVTGAAEDSHPVDVLDELLAA